jgi:hypothetical protein
MNYIVLKFSLFIAVFIIANNIYSQNEGELVGSNNRSINQNYKIPGNNEDVVEGFSYSDLKRQQNYNIKYQENSRKDLLKSHVLKQTKPTRKRMKQTLKKSQRLLAGKPVVTTWQVWVNRKKAFSQRKENKNED